MSEKEFSWREELKKCVKCGACMAVCPIYRQTGKEEMVARGKLNLIERIGEAEPEKLPAGWIEAIDNCLLCCSCEENCSKNVKITEIIAHARKELAEKEGLHPLKKGGFSLLTSRRLPLAKAIKAGALFQWLWARRLPEKSGLVRRLPLPYLDDKTVLPPLPRRNLDDRLAGRRPDPGLKKILYFPGCATRYLFPEMGLDLIFVLEKLGFAGIVPPEFACCGLVTWGAGDEATRNELMARNLEVFKNHAELETVVTGCASCGHALKEYKGLPEGMEILDISEFLFRHREKLEKLVGAKRRPEKITYHDPCHLRKGQQVTREPRWLLKLIAGENFVEMRHPERCCGAGGTFGISHKELSRRILAEKSADIGETGAQLVTSGCPGCLLQLTEGAVVAKAPWQARHPVSLLAELLRQENEKTAE